MQDDLSPAVAALIELGCNHEQQHQELLLTDILHLFAQNPLHPAYKDPARSRSAGPTIRRLRYRKFDGGVVEIGHDGEGFAFDCEGPRHRALIEPYELADRLVTNAEWMEFIADGGYRTPLLWLSAGWATVQSEGWSAPLYWEARDGDYWSMTLRGAQPVDPAAPVTHVSYFEADAFATWAGRDCRPNSSGSTPRLASRCAATSSSPGACAPRLHQPGRRACVRSMATCGNGRAAPSRPIRDFSRPKARSANTTASSCAGSSCCAAAPARRRSAICGPTYRNFFPPDARWQFSGLRLAGDLDMLDLVESKLSQHEAFRADVLAGLSHRQKTLPSRWLYDQRGSELFEEITRLDEYYLTRTETAILRRMPRRWPALCGEGAVLLEYGAGAAIKTEILIDALQRAAAVRADRYRGGFSRRDDRALSRSVS